MSSPISGFTAVPNPMMLSFLASQGFAIMYYGGSGWQFGKRKVSGMTNEQVNAISPHDFMMKLNAELKSMVPTMQQGMADMSPLITTTIEQFGTYIAKAIDAFPKAVQNILGTPGGEFANVPTSGGSQGNLPPEMMAFLHYFKKVSDVTKVTVPSFPLPAEEKSHAQRLAIQKIEDARVKRLQQLLEAKKNATIRQQARSGVAQLSLGQAERAKLDRKRKAGQSQRIERKRLIMLIRVGSKRNKSGNTIFPAARLRMIKQKLTNLLARYQF